MSGATSVSTPKLMAWNATSGRSVTASATIKLPFPGNWNIRLPTATNGRAFHVWDSKFYSATGTDRGTRAAATTSTPKIPGLDDLIAKMGASNPSDPASLSIDQDFMKDFVTNMYAIPVITFKKFITWDSRYWTGFPTSENPTAFPDWFHIWAYAFQDLKPPRRRKVRKASGERHGNVPLSKQG